MALPIPLAKDPAGTCAHEVAPALALIDPAGHGVAAAFPVPVAKEPAGAGVQALAPEDAVKVPAGHGVADVLPVGFASRSGSEVTIMGARPRLSA